MFGRKKKTSKVIRTSGFGTSVGGADDALAFVYCTDESGYCLSVCRYPDDGLVEVMVSDQLNYKTRDISVKLSREQLQLRLSPEAAAEMDGITEYIVPLSISEDELRELDEALTVIFEGGNRGLYTRLC